MTLAHRNIGNTHRLGKYIVAQEIVAAMLAMRQRGKSWGQVAIRFKLSKSGARNRVARRIGAP